MRLRMAGILAEANFATFVAVEADKVIGMVGVSASACYEQNERNGRIIALVVRADMRKRGLGRVLVAFAEEYLAKGTCAGSP